MAGGGDGSATKQGIWRQGGGDTGGEVAVATIDAGGSHCRPCCCWYWWGWAWLGWPSTRVGVWVQCTGVQVYVQGGMVWGQSSMDTGERAGVNADERAGRDGVRAGGFDLPFCRLLHLWTGLVLVVVGVSLP